MPRRQRWKPIRGTASRVYDRRERWLLAALDAPGRLAAGVARALGLAGVPRLEPEALREVLVLRLDRIGDLLMSLPALHDLRAALPRARIRLAVGRWGEEIARRAPVDEVLVWSAPWAGRPDEGPAGALELARAARALRRERLDLALDLQGDVRANGLLWLSGARARAGYANTGGGWLLSHVVPLDETLSWVEQNRRAVARVVGEAQGAPRFDPLTRADRDAAAELLREHGLTGSGPLVGLHPSGGRSIKQWPLPRWIAVARRLAASSGARFVITGSAADAPLAAELCAALGPRASDMSGRLGVVGSLALIDRLDLFLSPDTGPMHMACAVDTPSVSVFGPSDPVRYFSGGSGASGTRHVVVRHELWCAPCNLIRLPPEECRVPEGPECLLGVSVDAVAGAAEALLGRTAAT